MTAPPPPHNSQVPQVESAAPIAAESQVPQVDLAAPLADRDRATELVKYFEELQRTQVQKKEEHAALAEAHELLKRQLAESEECALFWEQEAAKGVKQLKDQGELLRMHAEQLVLLSDASQAAYKPQGRAAVATGESIPTPPLTPLTLILQHPLPPYLSTPPLTSP